VTATPFHIVQVGVAAPKFSRLMAHVQAKCGYHVSHVVTTAEAVKILQGDAIPSEYINFIDTRRGLTDANADDTAYLASLELPGIPTIHNMIRSDYFVSQLPYATAVSYCAFLARSLQRLYRQLKPSVVLAGHDRILAAMSAAVAASESLPWYSLSFSVLPVGYVGVSERVIPDELVPLNVAPTDELREQAKELLQEFEQRILRAPAYVSAHTVGRVIRKLGFHASGAIRVLRHQYGSESDQFNTNTIGFMARQYFRKRINLLRFPKAWFITEPPEVPYLFFGLHMQPESSIDVYAPFFANQLDTIEKMARAIPPTHKLLVKVHISDADNYSRAQLRHLRDLPGVLLVLPTVWSRLFIERSAGLIVISGTMGLEGALLGKPVIALGRMAYASFPTVARVGDLNEMPDLIRRQLAIPHPGRESIIAAYADYLSRFICATGPSATTQLDDWVTSDDPSIEELAGFVKFFRALEAYVVKQAVSVSQ
jgi:hypothetical protein